MKVERLETSVGVGGVSEVSDGQRPVAVEGPRSSVFRADVALIELRQRMSLDAQRETLASGVLASAHRVSMTIIGNMKA